MKKLQVCQPFQMDGSKWPPECDPAPHGFRVGNVYCVPDEVFKDAYERGWGCEPGTQPRIVETDKGPVELQPEDGVLQAKSSSGGTH